MKIAIISDTHGNVANFRKVVDWLNKENIQTILHCGDIGNIESLKESLADFPGEFLGVFGNMDKDFKILIEEYNKIPLGRSQMGEARVKINEDILETEIKNPSAESSTEAHSKASGQVKIAIVHFPVTAKKLAQSRNPSRASGQEYDLVFYGHTHKPWEEKIGVPAGGSCRLINPGELAGQFYKPCFAVYDTDTENLELKVLEKLG